MVCATMTIWADDGEKSLIADYAKALGTTVSDFMRCCALDRIEDELDLKAWNEAKAELGASSCRGCRRTSTVVMIRALAAKDLRATIRGNGATAWATTASRAISKMMSSPYWQSKLVMSETG